MSSPFPPLFAKLLIGYQLAVCPVLDVLFFCKLLVCIGATVWLSSFFSVLLACLRLRLGTGDCVEPKGSDDAPSDCAESTASSDATSSSSNPPTPSEPTFRIRRRRMPPPMRLCEYLHAQPPRAGMRPYRYVSSCERRSSSSRPRPSAPPLSPSLLQNDRAALRTRRRAPSLFSRISVCPTRDSVRCCSYLGSLTTAPPPSPLSPVKAAHAPLSPTPQAPRVVPHETRSQPQFASSTRLAAPLRASKPKRFHSQTALKPILPMAHIPSALPSPTPMDIDPPSPSARRCSFSSFSCTYRERVSAPTLLTPKYDWHHHAHSLLSAVSDPVRYGAALEGARWGRPMAWTAAGSELERECGMLLDPPYH